MCRVPARGHCFECVTVSIVSTHTLWLMNPIIKYTSHWTDLLWGIDLKMLDIMKEGFPSFTYASTHTSETTWTCCVAYALNIHTCSVWTAFPAFISQILLSLIVLEMLHSLSWWKTCLSIRLTARLHKNNSGYLIPPSWSWVLRQFIGQLLFEIM